MTAELETLLARAAERLEVFKLRGLGWDAMILKRLIDAVKALDAENIKLRECVEDFAGHGVRHDLNPSRMFNEDATETARWFLDYMKGMDNYVRDKAERVLQKN